MDQFQNSSPEQLSQMCNNIINMSDNELGILLKSRGVNIDPTM
jgi:hypothetical protein